MVYKANEYVLYIPKARFVAMGMVEWNLKSGSTDCTPSMVEWRHMIGSYNSMTLVLNTGVSLEWKIYCVLWWLMIDNKWYLQFLYV